MAPRVIPPVTAHPIFLHGRRAGTLLFCLRCSTSIVVGGMSLGGYLLKRKRVRFIAFVPSVLIHLLKYITKLLDHAHARRRRALPNDGLCRSGLCIYSICQWQSCRSGLCMCSSSCDC